MLWNKTLPKIEPEGPEDSAGSLKHWVLSQAQQHGLAEGCLKSALGYLSGDAEFSKKWKDTSMSCLFNKPIRQFLSHSKNTLLFPYQNQKHSPGQSQDPQFSSLPGLVAKHKPAVDSEATCFVLPGDYSGHRAEKIRKFTFRFNTKNLITVWAILSHKGNIQGNLSYYWLSFWDSALCIPFWFWTVTLLPQHSKWWY